MKCLIEYISFVWFSVWHEQTVALHSIHSSLNERWIKEEYLNECCWYYVITVKTKSMWTNQWNSKQKKTIQNKDAKNSKVEINLLLNWN